MIKRKKKEEEIVAEDKTQDLRRKYFGPEGELFKKRESLMKPIQDDIYNAVKQISETKRISDGNGSGIFCEYYICLSSH